MATGSDLTEKSIGQRIRIVGDGASVEGTIESINFHKTLIGITLVPVGVGGARVTIKHDTEIHLLDSPA